MIYSNLGPVFSKDFRARQALAEYATSPSKPWREFRLYLVHVLLYSAMTFSHQIASDQAFLYNQNHVPRSTMLITNSAHIIVHTMPGILNKGRPNQLVNLSPCANPIAATQHPQLAKSSIAELIPSVQTLYAVPRSECVNPSTPQ